MQPQLERDTKQFDDTALDEAVTELIAQHTNFTRATIHALLEATSDMETAQAKIPAHAPVAQLDRALPSEGRGQGTCSPHYRTG
jgi:hypothetical protein